MHIGMTLLRLGAALALLIACSITGAADRHEGVASCAGSTCHGATKPLGNAVIRQDEYFIWQQRDPHAGATATLGSERSRRMGALLGLNPQTATACLACHAENIPVARQGERWLASDGIGCESCHGGSERWLAPHTQRGITLEEKIALGMTPTWQPAVRAELCLGCHQGDAEHPISHAMMAAGHPVLLFELDTFTALEPPHHDRDADYAQRKGTQDPARDWAVGQAMAAEKLLQAVASGQLGHGLFPELVHFDCDACHHPTSAARWQPGRNAGAAAGTPPLADASLYWLGLWLGVAAPELAFDWQQKVAALQTGTGDSREVLQKAARALQQTLRAQVLPAAQQARLDAPQLGRLLKAIAATGTSPRAQDFLAAEQAAMAATVVSDALRQRGGAVAAAQQQALQKLYGTVRNRDQFNSKIYREALAGLAATY